MVRAWVRAGVRGMELGWVGGGVYRVPSQPLREGPRTAKRAPEVPAGDWSGWSWEPEYPVGTAPQTHPPGPVGHPAGALPGLGLRFAPPGQ